MPDNFIVNLLEPLAVAPAGDFDESPAFQRTKRGPNSAHERPLASKCSNDSLGNDSPGRLVFNRMSSRWQFEPREYAKRQRAIDDPPRAGFRQRATRFELQALPGVE
jgi:hypothetical protein